MSFDYQVKCKKCHDDFWDEHGGKKIDEIPDDDSTISLDVGFTNASEDDTTEALDVASLSEWLNVHKEHGPILFGW